MIYIIKLFLISFGKLLSKLLNVGLFFRLYNYCYERLPHRIVKILVKYVSLPNKDSYWKIVLINKKYVKTKIVKNNNKTMQFALSYKWHSPSLNFTEKILSDYYNSNIPWIDVGSNLGIRSLLFLSIGRPVYFIEPNMAVNEINIERCIRNGYKNYKLFEIGASDKKGEVEFLIDNSSYNSTIENESFDITSLEHREVIKTDTLDNLFRKNFDLWESACIKIDVEGHELKVIEGAKEFITKLSPTMIIEVCQKGTHFITFFEKMQTYGYVIYEIKRFSSTRFYNKINATKAMSNSSIKSNDFLCVKDLRLINIVEKYSI